MRYFKFLIKFYEIIVKGSIQQNFLEVVKLVKDFKFIDDISKNLGVSIRFNLLSLNKVSK